MYALEKGINTNDLQDNQKTQRNQLKGNLTLVKGNTIIEKKGISYIYVLNGHEYKTLKLIEKSKTLINKNSSILYGQALSLNSEEVKINLIGKGKNSLKYGRERLDGKSTLSDRILNFITKTKKIVTTRVFHDVIPKVVKTGILTYILGDQLGFAKSSIIFTALGSVVPFIAASFEALAGLIRGIETTKSGKNWVDSRNEKNRCKDTVINFIIENKNDILNEENFESVSSEYYKELKKEIRRLKQIGNDANLKEVLIKKSDYKILELVKDFDLKSRVILNNKKGLIDFNKIKDIRSYEIAIDKYKVARNKTIKSAFLTVTSCIKIFGLLTEAISITIPGIGLITGAMGMGIWLAAYALEFLVSIPSYIMSGFKFFSVDFWKVQGIRDRLWNAQKIVRGDYLFDKLKQQDNLDLKNELYRVRGTDKVIPRLKAILESVKKDWKTTTTRLNDRQKMDFINKILRDKDTIIIDNIERIMYILDRNVELSRPWYAKLLADNTIREEIYRSEELNDMRYKKIADCIIASDLHKYNKIKKFISDLEIPSKDLDDLIESQREAIASNKKEDYGFYIAKKIAFRDEIKEALKNKSRFSFLYA